MKKITVLAKEILSKSYLLALFALGMTIVFFVFEAADDWHLSVFHLARWAPTIGMLALISGQIDMLIEIKKGKQINIKARCLDFIHWFFLIFLNIGAWLVGGTPITWFLLKLVLLAVIAWQIGVGVGRQWLPNRNEKISGGIALTVALVFGSAAGFARSMDTTSFGWGWGIETVTAVFATLIVTWWIWLDLKNIKLKAEDYPRSALLKGIFSNSLIIWFWAHIMYLEGGLANGMVTQLGLTFNVLVGNILYWVYYLSYERQRYLQKH